MASVSFLAAAGGLPWWGWVLAILLAVLVLSVCFERLEKQKPHESVLEDPLKAAHSTVAGVASAVHETVKDAHQTATNAVHGRHAGDGSQQVFLRTASPHVHSYGTIQTMPPQQRMAVPSQQVGVHMPATRQSMQQPPPIQTAHVQSPRVMHTATVSMPPGAFHHPHMTMSPPGSPVQSPHGSMARPQFMASYPAYGQQGIQSPKGSPPGTWPNAQGAPLAHSQSMDSHGSQRHH
eukprot:TRINITY_DN84898_c0_g1_i1.p1 TRINITY_DN84898_c0_g1~~TRINITY_DN84898_c0_g1_i1.p1  ORF type:complete len:235 (-),score=25.86 TRINITY_DN84898_c0_g1_i1:114-818(-)